MQGERASLGYLSEGLNFEHGSTSSNGLMDHWDGLGDNDLQDYMIANSESLAHSVYPEQHRFSLGEEASSSGTKNEASSHNEQLRNEIIDLDSDSEQPSGDNQNVNLNAEYIELDEDIDVVEANGSGNRASQPGRPFQETSVRTGSSVDASCKRKAIEGSSSGQSSLGGYHHGESSSSWTPVSTEYRSVNGLNISGSRGEVSATASNFLVSSSRNTCVRSNPSETVSPAAFSAGTVVRRPVPPPHSNLSRLVPSDHHGQSLGNIFSRNPNPPAPVSRNMLPPLQWTESSLAGESFNSTVPTERNNLHLEDTRSRSITAASVLENPLFNPAPDLSRNANLSIASSSSVSRTGSSTGVQAPSSNLAWTPHRNLPPHQRRRSELAHRSLISSLSADARSGDHHPPLRSLAPPAPQDGLVLQPGGGDSSRAYSRAGLWLDRQVDSLVGAPQSLRALAAASRGRNRLMVSQMQNILEVMRRDPNHNLRLEDVMLLNQSGIFDGAAGMHDRYRDMRLDVDNMSYEELLALEERIGDVCTGVNEETISNRLKQSKYKSSTKSPEDAEPCCICQEEYTEGDDMGTLECGHEFHSQCIKEWLKQKNLCPICKTTGLNTAKKRKIG
ncbi:probable E3 ubiquitin-protein ligase RHG1A [Brassica rapa]|uniref:RING-type E3 ubiquitin transferase n=1 Tax=Brassica campestris TaxID=3711 RepID=M4EXW3_BRACM|nr:probable E3 ubiquitin-protein ligase RHG1A [Brassica rapa]